MLGYYFRVHSPWAGYASACVSVQESVECWSTPGSSSAWPKFNNRVASGTPVFSLFFPRPSKIGSNRLIQKKRPIKIQLKTRWVDHWADWRSIRISSNRYKSISLDYKYEIRLKEKKEINKSSRLVGKIKIELKKQVRRRERVSTSPLLDTNWQRQAARPLPSIQVQLLPGRQVEFRSSFFLRNQPKKPLVAIHFFFFFFSFLLLFIFSLSFHILVCLLY